MNTAKKILSPDFLKPTRYKNIPCVFNRGDFFCHKTVRSIVICIDASESGEKPMDKSDIYSINQGFDFSLSEITTGDSEKLSQLYCSLKRPVFLLALSILGNYALAEDVMQDTFLKIQENASSYRPGTNAKAWVMTITRNLALNMLKKRGREDLSLDSFIETETGGEIDMTGSVDFTRALSLLEETERCIVTLKAICGFRHAQIAKITGITTADCRARYSRALKKLRKYYLETKTK